MERLQSEPVLSKALGPRTHPARARHPASRQDIHLPHDQHGQFRVDGAAINHFIEGLGERFA